MKIWLLIPALALTACVPETQKMHEVPPDAASGELATNPRVEAARIGVFKDELAYHEKRGVYLIKDTKTGTEYIGVSGIGITEIGSHSCGKNCRARDER